jgi:hypothetical protein
MTLPKVKALKLTRAWCSTCCAGRRFDNAGPAKANKLFNDYGATVMEDSPQTGLSRDQEEERSGQGQRGSRLDQ